MQEMTAPRAVVAYGERRDAAPEPMQRVDSHAIFDAER